LIIPPNENSQFEFSWGEGMRKEMDKISRWFKFIWGWSLVHSSSLVLNPHALITKEGGLPHQPPPPFNDWWLWIFNKAHSENMKVRRLRKLRIIFYPLGPPFLFPYSGLLSPLMLLVTSLGYLY
jgi:hypothetical protein